MGKKRTFKKVDLIPIGTICYEAGDFSKYTKQIVVNEDNQKQITMFWNSIYFLEKEEADYITNQEKRPSIHQLFCSARGIHQYTGVGI